MNKYNIKKDRRCQYQLIYQIVWCTKDKQPIFSNMNYKEMFKQIIYEKAQEKNIKINLLYINKDYIKLMLECKPSTTISELVKMLKGSTAKQLKARCPEIKRNLKDNHFWNNSYLVITGSDDITGQIETYIEQQ